MNETEEVRCALYRGGTSRGVLFLENDLPFQQSVREQILLSIFGSPDVRQINGVGGGTSPTSKAMIVGPSRTPGVDVQMLFGQVSITAPLVDWGGSCGNLTAAVGPFAIDHCLVPCCEPVTSVRIYSANTKKLVTARVPVRHGRALSQGDYAIPGVPGTGARIDLEWHDPAGSFSGQVLPTGSPRDIIELEDGRHFTVSIVDAGNPVVFCDARELQLTGTELPSELEARQETMRTLESIRSMAAVRLGIVEKPSEATTRSPGLPKVGFVSRPAPYVTLAGNALTGQEVDIVGRLLSMQTPHRAYMGTGAICTAAAAIVDGTLVHELVASNSRRTDLVRIGHPSGVMDVHIDAARENGALKIRSATFSRTARRILEGCAYVPRDLFGWAS